MIQFSCICPFFLHGDVATSPKNILCAQTREEKVAAHPHPVLERALKSILRGCANKKLECRMCEAYFILLFCSRSPCGF